MQSEFGGKLNRVIFLAALMLSSLAHSSPGIDIEFQSSGNQVYRTTTLESDIKKYYGFKVSDPRVLLVVVESLNSPELIEQNNAIDGLGHDVEQYKLIYVISCKNETYEHGYHTSKEVASSLASAEEVFKVILLGSSGKVLKQSNQPVSSKELRKWLGE